MFQHHVRSFKRRAGPSCSALLFEWTGGWWVNGFSLRMRGLNRRSGS
jgi:hypothetical protein